MNYYSEIPKNISLIMSRENHGEEFQIAWFFKNKTKKIRDKLRYLDSDDLENRVEEFVLKNGLFTLELHDKYSMIIIRHPDLPLRDVPLVLPLSETWWHFLDLLKKCKNMTSRVLEGTYYYDPTTKFFKLNDKMDSILMERVRFGKYIDEGKKKLIPGNRYIIKRSRCCRELIYLGDVKDILTVYLDDYYYNRRNENISISALSKDLLNIGNTIYVNRNTFRVFKNDLDEYFLIKDPRRTLKGSLVEENVCPGMSEQEFRYLCSTNDWLFGLNKNSNKDQIRKIITDLLIKYIKNRSGFVFLGNLLDPHTTWAATDLSKYASKQLYDKLFDDLKPNNVFHNLLNYEIFGLENEEVKDLLHEVWIACFGKD